MVKSNSATVTVPELQFEIPPGTQKGVITTVEGLLTDASTGLRCASDQMYVLHRQQVTCPLLSTRCQLLSGVHRGAQNLLWLAGRLLIAHMFAWGGVVPDTHCMQQDNVRASDH